MLQAPGATSFIFELARTCSRALVSSANNFIFSIRSTNMSTNTSNHSHTLLPSVQHIRQAYRAVGNCLNGNITYALVGGAACQSLGSNRLTSDVDLVVPQGQIGTARRLLAADMQNFTVDPRTLHTHYNSNPPIQIELLSPPTMFREQFDQDTPTVIVEVDGTELRVLQPKSILNAKCRSILGRATDERKAADSRDILFLLKYLGERERGNRGEVEIQVPNATQEFMEWFIERYGHRSLWQGVGLA